MHVVVKLALGLHTHEAAEGHVFTDLADKVFANLFQGLAVQIEFKQSSHIGRGLFGNQARSIFGHLLEFRVLRHKVRFGI